MSKDTDDIVERIRTVFSDTKEVVSWCDDTYYGKEISIHLLGLYVAALKACNEIERLRRENSILRHELKERLVSEWIVNYEMSEEETEKAADQYIIQMVAHNEGAE